MTKTAFIGLGVMGYPMAGHLAKEGHDVTIYNRTEAKADKWVNEFNGRKALTPRDAAKDAEVICCCVGNDDDLRSVTYGENGILANLRKNSIFIDHTTASADVAREINKKSKEIEIHFLDAPVSRFGARDCFIPSAANLELEVLPSVETIRAAAEKVLAY